MREREIGQRQTWVWASGAQSPRRAYRVEHVSEACLPWSSLVSSLILMRLVSVENVSEACLPVFPATFRVYRAQDLGTGAPTGGPPHDLGALTECAWCPEICLGRPTAWACSHPCLFAAHLRLPPVMLTPPFRALFIHPMSHVRVGGCECVCVCACV